MSARADLLPKGATVIEKDGVPDCETMAKAWREHLGLTQAEVAARLGISKAAYSKLENSTRQRPSTRRRLAEALGISAEQLVQV